MRICKNCDNELLDGVTVCPFCGCIVENNAEYQNIETQSTKKNGKGKGILVTIVAVIIARLIGGFVGEFTAKNVIESSQKNDIEEFIGHMEKYVPGYCDGNEYVSKKFGFRFVIDENWEFCMDEDLRAASEGLKASATTSALAALEKEDVPQDVQEKFAESIYAETEMGAFYIADNMYVGEVTVAVMSVYGIEDMLIEDYIGEINNRLNINAQVTDEYIAGSSYKVLSANITDVNGIDTSVRMYAKIEENMICMITCRAMIGYEEQLFKAFEDGISAYK